MMNEVVLHKLREYFGPKRFFTDEATLYSYAFDASFGTYLPQGVAQVERTEDVVFILQLANEYLFPVYPRGHATSLSGGPLPVLGGLVLDMLRMNQILEIDVENLVAVVSPGVITAEIHQAAEAHGLFYPPDPSSANISTIGGNIAENAGGSRGLKYGVTRDYVIGLEVVTAQGEILHLGGKTMKNVTGYDMKKLIVGSEGTLAIVTKATLRLIPKPKIAKTLMVTFSDLVTSGKAVSAILTSGILPTAIEIADQSCIKAVESYRPLGLPTEAAALVLIELDGHPLAVEAEMQETAAICARIGASSVRIAEDQKERDQMWLARKLISPAIARIAPTKISEDVAVPRGQIPVMFARLQEIKSKYNVNLVVFGHAGDGNLHPNIVTDVRNEAEIKRVEKAISEIFHAAISLGGALSGEHGIGLMKAPYLPLELGEVGVEMMKRIKTAWDPNNILNPGKIFPQNQEKEIHLLP